MFWEDVIGKPAELNRANVEREWRRRKHKMEKASRRSWKEDELRECALSKFGKIFVDDRQFWRDACFMHANVQNKAVFSCAMTVMEAICGWEDEEKRVGSKFAACMSIFSKEVLTRGDTQPVNGIST